MDGKRKARREAEVLKSNLTSLATAISNPESIALELFSRDIISQDAYDKVRYSTDTPRQKAVAVLMLVYNVLTVPCMSEIFDEFLQVLKKQPSLLRITRILEEERNALFADPPEEIRAPSPVDERQPSPAAPECSLPVEKPIPASKLSEDQHVSSDSPVLAKLLPFSDPFESLPSYITASRLLRPATSVNDVPPNSHTLVARSCGDGSNSFPVAEADPLSLSPPSPPREPSTRDSPSGVSAPDCMPTSDMPAREHSSPSGQDVEEASEREELSCAAMASPEASDPATSTPAQFNDDDGQLL